jgi:lipopolysaccharide transport system permease protein
MANSLGTDQSRSFPRKPLTQLADLPAPTQVPGDPAVRESTQIITIQASKGWVPLHLGELWDYRDLLYFMVWRDLKARYRQTALGPLWIILQPILSMVLYTVLLGYIAKLPSDNVPYTVFSFVGLMPWGFFADAVNSGSLSLLGSKDLITKVYFPRLLIPLAQTISSLVDLGISFIILLAMLVYYGIHPNWGVILIPVFVLIAATTGLGVGIWFSGIIVRFRDFGNVAGYLVRVWMYATPVVYSISLIPPEIRFLYRLNPMTVVVDGFRWALLGTASPPDWTLGMSVFLALLVATGGLFVFRRVERTIVDIV